MRSRSNAFVWIIGLAIGLAAGALAAMLLLPPDAGSSASGATLISGVVRPDKPPQPL